jgi:uncharacterized C2H2 Zn-finger protein
MANASRAKVRAMSAEYASQVITSDDPDHEIILKGAFRCRWQQCQDIFKRLGDLVSHVNQVHCGSERYWPKYVIIVDLGAECCFFCHYARLVHLFVFFVFKVFSYIGIFIVTVPPLRAFRTFLDRSWFIDNFFVQFCVS